MSGGGRVTMFPRDGWWVATWWEERGGERKKRQRRLKTQDKRVAEVERAKLDEQLMSGKLGGARTRIAFQDFMADYEKAYLGGGGSEGRPSRTRNWHKKERRALDRLFEYAREKKLATIDQITVPLVEKHKLRLLGAGLATATVNHDVRVIKAAFSWAADEGDMLDVHPLQKLKQIPGPQPTIEWLRAVDAEGVVRLAPGYIGGRAILLYLYLGLRLNEAIYAREGDADLDANLFRVKNRAEEGFLTKSRQLRSIPIPPELRVHLLAWRGATPDPTRLLCPDSKGGRLDEANLRKACKSIGKALGISFSPQTLRRTFATILRERGVEIEKISAYLGHSSIAVTEKWYAGVDLKGDDEAAAKLTFTRPAPGTIVKDKAERPDDGGGPAAVTA